jgi:hypothetical protein
MFKTMLAVQWKWTKGAAFLATLLGFLIPIASVQLLSGLSDYRTSPAGIVALMQGFGVAYATLAGGTGLAFAVIAWSQDHRGRHVYALSLPIRRGRYAAYRFIAGASFLLLPAAGVLIGSLVALSVAHIPLGLHGYPVALTLRFLVSSAVAFAIFFSIAASTPRTAGMVLGSIAGLFLVAGLIGAMGVRYDLLGHVSTLLFEAPGVLAVFTGRWMLIDV